MLADIWGLSLYSSQDADPYGQSVCLLRWAAGELEGEKS